MTFVRQKDRFRSNRKEDMKWEDYTAKFEDILEGRHTDSPYDKADYLEYAKLNNSRTNRWMKRGELTEETKQALASISTPQKWILITEHWCGDAANTGPFIKKMVDQNSNLELEIQLRDSGSEIDNYLTNGGKAVPKLIVRDEEGNDLFTWGARPSEAAALVIAHKESDLDAKTKKAELQKWYNSDKGVSVQQEITSLLSR